MFKVSTLIITLVTLVAVFFLFFSDESPIDTDSSLLAPTKSDGALNKTSAIEKTSSRDSMIKALQKLQGLNVSVENSLGDFIDADNIDEFVKTTESEEVTQLGAFVDVNALEGPSVGSPRELGSFINVEDFSNQVNGEVTQLGEFIDADSFADATSADEQVVNIGEIMTVEQFLAEKGKS